MKCSTCGADNDAANKFCDQCGSRLQSAMPAAAPALEALPNCPNCGAAIVPGEAFCDECGTALTTPVPAAGGMPIVNNDAPTVFAPPAGLPLGGPTCTVCGRQNAPGDRFCDECGASLAEDPAAVVPPVPEPVVPPAEPLPDVVAQSPVDTPPAEAAAPVEVPEAAAVAAADDETLVAPALDAQVAYDARRNELEAEIARQQQIISQLEPVQQALGAATPAGVAQSLTEAREGLARTEAELAALTPPTPAVDPAEVARLEAEIARQQQIISQLEPVQQALGAATPAGVAQSLTEAREGLARTEAELAALTGGVAPAATPAVEPPVAAPDEVAAPAAPVVIEAEPAPIGPNEPTIFSPIDAVPPPLPPTPAAAPAARLVVENGGATLPLPTDRSEIVVGREDPISGIHPEVDMTPYGGETGGVSRQHARITRSDGVWMIVDLNSTNYTRVDGIKLDPGVPMALKDGSKIQFGRVTVIFHE